MTGWPEGVPPVEEWATLFPYDHTIETCGDCRQEVTTYFPNGDYRVGWSLTCTLAKGHEGWHAGHGGYGLPYGIWPPVGPLVVMEFED